MKRRGAYNPFQGELGSITHEIDLNRSLAPKGRKLGYDSTQPARLKPIYSPSQKHVQNINAKLALPKFGETTDPVPAPSGQVKPPGIPAPAPRARR